MSLHVLSCFCNTEISHADTKKFWPIGRAMIVAIIILHVMAAIDFALCWSYVRLIFVKHGQTIVDEYLAFLNYRKIQIPIVITGIVSTICVDSAMVPWLRWVCARADTKLTLNDIFILDLALLDGLGKALAHCCASDPFSHIWNWCDNPCPLIFPAYAGLIQFSKPYWHTKCFLTHCQMDSVIFFWFSTWHLSLWWPFVAPWWSFSVSWVLEGPAPDQGDRSECTAML